MKKHIGILVIALLLSLNCSTENGERFFTQESLENELDQALNIDVLNRIKNDTSITSNEMVFSFYFISDQRKKLEALIDYLEKNEPSQTIIEFNQINEIWELNGRTYPIPLEINAINVWERKMWNIGFQFDCKLDGWETTDHKLNFF